MPHIDTAKFPDNFDVALSYIQDLQARRPDVYPQFLDLLAEYRAKPDNIENVRARVEELLKDEPDLLVRFEGFLPRQSIEQPNGEEDRGGTG